jgi:hypothetical protein
MDIEGSKTYHRGDGFAIASLPGFKSPVILLEPELATRLGRIWYAANVRMATTFPGQGVDAVRDLCAVLAPIFTHFGSAMVESGVENPLPRDVQRAAHAIQQELDRIAKLIEDFDPDNWPGGGGEGKA